MKYILYGAPGSGSGIVEAACAEIGVEVEVRNLDPFSRKCGQDTSGRGCSR
jgi:hypothetical protein